MLIVRAHQDGASGERALRLEAQHRRDALLIFEGELIEMPLAQEMQRVAHPEKKVARLQHLGQFRRGDNRALYQFLDRMDFVFYFRQPQRGVQIAQSAFTFLQLRLQQVDRVAVLGVALAGFLSLI